MLLGTGFVYSKVDYLTMGEPALLIESEAVQKIPANGGRESFVSPDEQSFEVPQHQRTLVQVASQTKIGF